MTDSLRQHRRFVLVGAIAALAIAGVLGVVATMGTGGTLGLKDGQRNNSDSKNRAGKPDRPQEVVFWHFWGGDDRDVVESIVEKFNDSQTDFFVRPVAMPGNNLNAKLFLSVAGGDPPDIVNQDDPVLADWATRGVIQSVAEISSDDQAERISAALLAPARRLSRVGERLFGVCNGLDIRALIYNQTALKSAGLPVPETIQQLDAIAEHFAPTTGQGSPGRLKGPVGFLPDSRRLWAWGPVFGATFLSSDNVHHPSKLSLGIDSQQTLAALQWMASYGRQYGADNLASFRQGDQSLPGKAFPLLPTNEDSTVGRYVVMMDGQWRVRDLAATNARRAELNLPTVEFGVCPLPFPDADADRRPDGKGCRNAGWVNGNFFVFPSGAKCPQGALAFAEFWIGLNQTDDADTDPADWYGQGGWIPVTAKIIQSAGYRDYLKRTPLMKPFVDLAFSDAQYPIPNIVGAAMLKREVENLTYDAMMNDLDRQSVQRLLQDRSDAIENQLKLP